MSKRQRVSNSATLQFYCQNQKHEWESLVHKNSGTICKDFHVIPIKLMGRHHNTLNHMQILKNRWLYWNLNYQLAKNLTVKFIHGLLEINLGN